MELVDPDPKMIISVSLPLCDFHKLKLLQEIKSNHIADTSDIIQYCNTQNSLERATVKMFKKPFRVKSQSVMKGSDR